MFMRPDTWPQPPRIGRTPKFSIFPLIPDSHMPSIGRLPIEILIPIVRDVPIASLFALLSTCRSLGALIAEQSFLDQEAITRGCLRWILPLESLRDEKKRAYDALRLWFPEDSRPEEILSFQIEPGSSLDQDDEDEKSDDEAILLPQPDTKSFPAIASLIVSPGSPRLAFVRECWESDSIMNRKRLWDQVAQFSALWEDYRIRGLRVNRFYLSNAMPASQ
ncbi:unnamed protein product [Somion occarium]|uniref:F-box domain-containing protein n=1 Tax=Somion occarium TaxID=3059160 RepID=A0ABP1DW56_9APHY